MRIEQQELFGVPGRLDRVALICEPVRTLPECPTAWSLTLGSRKAKSRTQRLMGEFPDDLMGEMLPELLARALGAGWTSGGLAKLIVPEPAHYITDGFNHSPTVAF